MDNTAQSWGAALLKLAEEAEHDAGEHDTSLALHTCLTDLANVARAYAGRLDEVEKTELPVAAAPTDAPANFVPFNLAPLSSVKMNERLDAVEHRVDLLSAPQGEGGLPEWLMATLRSHDERITALEARAQFNTVAPGAFALDALMPLDDDRTAWDSIDRARAALRGMAAREHRDRSAIRQKVLEAVASLARQPDLASDPQATAELRQHEERAQELAVIDAILGVKFDEIAALDDLELARAFDVTKGWPS